MASKNIVAERFLLLAKEPSGPRETIRVAIGAPYDLPADEAKDIGVKSACDVYIGPVDAEPSQVYGVDTIQAVSIAVAEVDMFLVGLSQQGSLFWRTGEPYDSEISAPLPEDLSEAVRVAFKK